MSSSYKNITRVTLGSIKHKKPIGVIGLWVGEPRLIVLEASSEHRTGLTGAVLRLQLAEASLYEGLKRDFWLPEARQNILCGPLHLASLMPVMGTSNVLSTRFSFENGSNFVDTAIKVMGKTLHALKVTLVPDTLPDALFPRITQEPIIVPHRNSPEFTTLGAHLAKKHRLFDLIQNG